MAEKLTAVMADALALACERGQISYHEAAAIGASGRTLDGLVRRDFIAKYTFANGHRWLPTDAGRAALALSSKDETNG